MRVDEDYYQLLGVERTASVNDIKAAFRKRAKETHPDQNPNNPNAEAEFKKISESYSVLGNVDKRSRYDREGKAYGFEYKPPESPKWDDLEEFIAAHDTGEPFAFGFYSGLLHRKRPACTFIFSRLYWSDITGAYLEDCETTNILFRQNPFDFGDQSSIEAFQKLLAEEYPDVAFKGVFTDNNFLLTQGYGPLKVVGLSFLLNGFENGPMKRVDPPRRPDRKHNLRLVTLNGTTLRSGPNQ